MKKNIKIVITKNNNNDIIQNDINNLKIIDSYIDNINNNIYKKDDNKVIYNLQYVINILQYSIIYIINNIQYLIKKYIILILLILIILYFYIKYT
jgi:hypothetical protein